MAANLQIEDYVEADQKRLLKGLFDGSLSIASFLLGQSLKGNCFMANAGSGTSPITCGAGSIDTTEPDLLIIVPDGTTIIPYYMHLQVEAFGTTAIFEALMAVGSGAAAGTTTAVTPTNLNVGSSNLSNCTVGAASAADSTYMTTRVSEIWRAGAAKVATVGTGDDDSEWPPQHLTWTAQQTGVYPIVRGVSGDDGGLAVFAAAQASTAFIQCAYVELKTSDLP